MEKGTHAQDCIPLSEALRLSTRARHAQAERAGFMPLLLNGRLPQHDYCRLLRNLHAIYVSLENGLKANRMLPIIAGIYDPALSRVPAIESDLAFLHGDDWRESLASLPEADEYASRMDRQAVDDPCLLIAHAYVRYLGDLSGGQILQRTLARTLALTDARGTQFYHFPFADLRERATVFRNAMDAAALDPAERCALIEESDWAFQQHIRLFEALDRTRLSAASGDTPASADR